MSPTSNDHTRWAKLKEVVNNVIYSKGWKAAGALLLILILFLADFRAMYILFHSPKMDVRSADARLYSFIFALCLEGIPTFLGSALAVWIDKAQYRSNDKPHAKWGLWVCGLVTALMFLLAIGLRIITIYSKGGMTGFLNDKYPDFPIDLFLVFSPILTSALAFALSWFTLQNDNEKIMERKVDMLQRRYIVRQSEFLKEYQNLQDARSSLWTTLTAHRLTPEEGESAECMEDVLDGDVPNELSKWMPNKSEVFRKECFARIRGKLIENCITSYPSQAARYNEAVESALSVCLEAMRSRTSLSIEFSELSIRDILEEFDKIHTDTEDVWAYEKAKGPLENELRRLVDNAIIVAQKKTTASPYPLERY